MLDWARLQLTTLCAHHRFWDVIFATTVGAVFLIGVTIAALLTTMMGGALGSVTMLNSTMLAIATFVMNGGLVVALNNAGIILFLRFFFPS